MKKIVLDADGLIKLAKAGILEQVAREVRCIISDSIYQEAVQEGKKRLYEDAFAIEEQIKKGNIAVEKTLVEKKRGAEKGESSCIALYKKIKANAIVSDDQKFLRELEQQHIPFLTPTTLIIMVGKRNSRAALRALEKIKPIIKPHAYQSAKKELGGK